MNVLSTELSKSYVLVMSKLLPTLLASITMVLDSLSSIYVWFFRKASLHKYVQRAFYDFHGIRDFISPIICEEGPMRQ